MRYKALLFGIDGVLCNTDEMHRIAWKQVCDNLSIAYPFADDEFTLSHSRTKVLDTLLACSNLEFSDAEKNVILEEKNDIYQQLLLDSLSKEAIIPGAIEMLSKIRSEEYKIAAVTPSKNGILLLKRLKLYEYFDIVVDGNDLDEDQQEERLFVRAATELCIFPHNALVIDAHIERLQRLHAYGFPCLLFSNSTGLDVQHISSMNELTERVLA